MGEGDVDSELGPPVSACMSLFSCLLAACLPANRLDSAGDCGTRGEGERIEGGREKKKARVHERFATRPGSAMRYDTYDAMQCDLMAEGPEN